MNRGGGILSFIQKKKCKSEFIQKTLVKYCKKKLEVIGAEHFVPIEGGQFERSAYSMYASKQRYVFNVNKLVTNYIMPALANQSFVTPVCKFFFYMGDCVNHMIYTFRPYLCYCIIFI